MKESFFKIFITQTLYTVRTRINFKIVPVTNLNIYTTVHKWNSIIYIYIYVQITAVKNYEQKRTQRLMEDSATWS